MTLRMCKRVLREFMHQHYTDERLNWLLAHARDGKLSFASCCCFVGVVTATHALRGSLLKVTGAAVEVDGHYQDARLLPGALEAEDAFRLLGWSAVPKCDIYEPTDALRRRRIIPMVKAELRIRERRATLLPALVEVGV
jgi:hypothetical protein